MLLFELLTQLPPQGIIPEFDFFSKLGPKFFVRLIINLASVFVLIRFIYYPVYRKKNFFFTYFMFNTVIFIITFMLNKVELSMGAAFGLFAVFSLLRYRTENISAKDMTYLFLVIALGLISAVAKGTFFETAILNCIILMLAWLLDGNLFMKNENTQKVQYENIEMIKPANHQKLIEDLRKRTGLDIYKISISKINFMKDTAMVKIYYNEQSGTKLLPEHIAVSEAVTETPAKS
jgi:hypothetical protein